MFKIGDTVKILYHNYFGQIGIIVGVAYISLEEGITKIYDVDFTHTYSEWEHRNIVFEDPHMLKEYIFYSASSKVFHPKFLQLIDKQVIEGTLLLLTSKIFKVDNIICTTISDKYILTVYENTLVRCEGRTLHRHFKVTHIEAKQ